MAPICQKCGHTGFQEVMIYCRQCWKSCEHKYCLFKFPKKGEKVRWYCEECRPTIFPVSPPDKLEDDIERSKSDLKCSQILQNQNQNQDQNQDRDQNKKTKGLSVSSISQLEKVQEDTKSIKSLSSDLGENGKSQTLIRSILSNKDQVDQNVPSTPLTHSPSPTTCCVTTRDEVYVPEPIIHRNNSHQETVVHNPEYFGENGKSQTQRRSILSSKDQIDQNVPNIPLTHLPPPTTSGVTTVHVESVPETIVHRNNCHQETVEYNPEYFNQIHPYIARPIVYYIWRGCISFGDGDFVPFIAHGSSLACQRVFDAARLLPPILPMEKYLRHDLYQSIFKKGPPADNKIGLYFFPDSYARPELVFRLIDNIIKNDLMFVYAFGEVEMLVFPSCILPEEHHKFCGQYYLWAAFRNKQLPVTVTPANNNSEPIIEYKEYRQDEQKVLTCSESQKSVPNAMKKHIENEEEIHGNNLNSPITEKKILTVDGVNKKRVREENGNCSKNFTSLDTENRKSIEEMSKKYKQQEMTTSSLSKCIGKKKQDQVTYRKPAENKETHASTLIDKCAKQTFADRSKQQSKRVTFANNYVSDFYRYRKTEDEIQRLLVANKKAHRQEKDEINANNNVSSACTGKQRPVQGTIKNSLQKKEKLCSSSSISKYTEMQKLADESKKRERIRLCTEKPKLLDGSKKLMVNRDELHPNADIRLAAEKQKQVYASNPNSLAMKMQKPAYDLGKKERNREDNPYASLLIRKCTEKQMAIDESNVSVSACMDEQMTVVGKSKLKEQKRDVEHAPTTISTYTGKQQQGAPVSKSVRKPKQDKESCHGQDEDKTAASKKLPLEETTKKHVRDGNEIASIPLLRASPKPEKIGHDAETVASNPSEMARKKDADNEDEIQSCSEEKMEKISQYVDETQASPVSSTCTNEQKPSEKMNNFDGSEELEEGEICEELLGRDGREIYGSGYNVANDCCLSLFPLTVEDMGVASKVDIGKKLSLDLGLGRS